MVVRPLNASAFRDEVLEPVRGGALGSRDGGDQGALNSLLYARGTFGAVGAGARVLPSTYNALARVARLRPAEWAAMAPGPAIVHFSRETKPWQLFAEAASNATSTSRGRYRIAHAQPSPLQLEWQRACLRPA